MLEVVFSDSAAGTMAVAIGHKGFLGGATSVIISDGTVSKEEIEKFQAFKQKNGSVLVGRMLYRWKEIVRT